MKLAFCIKGIPLVLILWLACYAPANGASNLNQELLLTEALELISEQYQVVFSYEAKVLSKMKVDFSIVEGEQLESSVNRLLVNTDLKYKYLGDKFYVIFRNSREGIKKAKKVERKLQQIRKLEEGDDISFRRAFESKTRRLGTSLQSVISAKEEIAVSGTVQDQDGLPLIGATVLVKGTGIGTSTDLDGKFELSDVGENGILVISYTGYQSLEVSVNGESSLAITLVENAEILNEVVVVGYGTQKRVNLSGAVDVISNKQIIDRPATTVSQILQGQSPGVNIQPGYDGYEPGAKLQVDVRGIGSLNGGQPYILIDGFPGDMDLLNPEDIESISILKDAAASAIYGARAPYGVILITTKSGKKDQPISFSYSNNISLNYPTSVPKLLDSYTYARVLNESGDNWGGRSYSNAVVDRIIAYQNGDFEYLKQFLPDGVTHFETVPGTNGQWARGNESHANYDWIDEFYGHGFNQRHNLSVQGGSEKTSYYLSAGFQDQEGMLNYGVDTYKRFNILGKMNTAVTDWMDFRYETRFVKSPREKYNGGLYRENASTYISSYRQITRQIPTQAKYDGFGNLDASFIPDIEGRGTNRYETTENWQTLATEIRPLKGWKINADFAYQLVNVDGTIKILRIFRHDVNNDPYPTYSAANRIGTTQSVKNYWVTNAFTSYDWKINENHNLFVMAGMQYESNRYNFLEVSKLNLVVQDVPSLETATGDPIAGQELSQWATQGYFSRVMYNFREKYLFEANARYDGTSRFKSENRWGFFPSFSVGWNIDKEPFWEGIRDQVGALKLRASWGQLGNQQVSPYSDLALIPLQTGKLNWIFDQGGNRPIGYTSTPSLVSPNLTWETATTTNFGLNMLLLDNRLNVDLDIFDRTTENMIGPSSPVPGLLGTNVPRSNNATLQSRGWELSARWAQTLQGRDIDWFLSFNISDVKTKVTEYLNPSGLVSSWYPGKEVGEIWGYSADALFQSQEDVDSYLEKVDMSFLFNNWLPGDVKYLDTNGDGAVNPGANTIDDHGDISIIGNSTPRFQYGISGGANIRNFDFSFLIRGTGKRDYFVDDGNGSIRFWGIRRLPFTSLTEQHLDYFRDQPGDKYTGLYEGDANINLDAYWPRPYAEPVQNGKNRYTSSRYLINAAFVRLQNIQIGYSISKRVLEKINVKKFRIFISGENLFTNSDLLDGIDPAAIGQYGPGLTYSSDKIFAAGVNVSW